MYLSKYWFQNVLKVPSRKCMFLKMYSVLQSFESTMRVTAKHCDLVGLDCLVSNGRKSAEASDLK